VLIIGTGGLGEYRRGFASDAEVDRADIQAFEQLRAARELGPLHLHTVGGQALFQRQFHRVLPRRHRPQQLGQLSQRQLREFADVHPGKLHRQRRLGQPLAVAQRAGACPAMRGAALT